VGHRGWGDHVRKSRDTAWRGGQDDLSETDISGGGERIPIYAAVWEIKLKASGWGNKKIRQHSESILMRLFLTLIRGGAIEKK